MKKYALTGVFFLVGSLFFAHSVVAQTVNSRIEGVVRDSNLGLVPNATVKISNSQTNQVTTVVSNDNGRFSALELAPGEYVVIVQAAGFSITRIEKVIVEVGTPVVLNIELKIGAVDETVEISSDDAMDTVNTSNAEIGDVVDRRRILELPLDGRNPLDLIALQAGADETGEVNGNRTRAINITVNGINASDNFNKSADNVVNNPTVPVSVESIREFRVTTGMATAEYGRGSAQVNVVSQSGGKDYRGSVFMFHRNTVLNANTFFNNKVGAPREFLLRNQFGGRFGGPVRIPKILDGDRTFFFFAYEGTRLTASETSNSTVYTAEAKAGNFRWLQGMPITPANVAANPGLIRSRNLYDLTNRTPDPFMETWLGDIPLPNNFDVGDGLNWGGYRFNAKRSAPRDIYSFRGDHRINDKYTLEFNYSYADDLQYGDYVNARYQRFPGRNGIDRLTRSRSMSAALQMNWTPQTVNEFRFGFANPTTMFGNESYKGDYLLVLNTVTDPIRYTAPNGRKMPITQFMDNLTHVRGNHMIKAGFDIRFLGGKTHSYDGSIPEVNLNSTDNDPGFATSMFPGISTSNSPITLSERLVNNLTGAIGSIDQIFYADSSGQFVPGSPLHRNYKTSEFDFYLQDTWKVRERISLNLGLRYEFSTVPKDTDELFVLPEGGLQGLYGPTSPSGHFVPGNATNPRTINNLVPADYKLFKTDANNFAPVISVAWSPFKNDKTSVRAGHRFSYIRENFNLYENIARTNQGLSVSRELIVGSNPNLSRFLRTGVPVIPTPSVILPLSMQQQFQGASTTDIAGFDPDLETPYIQEWVASVEHQIFKNTVLEARYVGNRGMKLIRVHDINEVNVNAYDPVSGQTFLEAFLLAQTNLANNVNINTNNPLFARIFTTQSTSSAITTPITTGQAGELADIISRRSVGGLNGGLLFNSGLPINFFRPNPDVRGAYIAANGSRSSFHALQLEVRRRFRQGLSFQANYQFGKQLSDYTGTTTNQSAFITQLDPDYEYRQQNRAHQFKANFVYELPFGRGKTFFDSKGWRNALIGGWQLGGIFRWESGYPLTVRSNRGTVNSAARSVGNSVDLITGASIDDLRSELGLRTINGNIYFFDPSFALNFANPQPGKLGSFPRSIFFGPTYFRADISMIKRTSITKRQNIEFRAEVFNAFNNVNFDTPNMDFNSANFGMISDVRGGTLGQPRIIQFALRYNF